MSKVYSSVRLFSQTILRAAACLAALFIFTGAGNAATITVDRLGDTITADGGCTLREAITNANNDTAGNADCAAGAVGEDTINITVAGTINLVSTLPFLTSDMLINGQGAGVTIVKRGNTAAGAPEFRIIFKTGGNSTISALTVSDGVVRGFNDFGGTNGSQANGAGILNNGGALTLTNLVVTNNRTIGGNGSSGTGGLSTGGGIRNGGTMTITNSTVSSNFSTGGNGTTGGGQASGSGIFNTGALTLSNVVIANNQTIGGNNTGGIGGQAGSGGLESSGVLTITDSTVSGNTATGGTGSTNGGVAFGGGFSVTAGTATITNIVVSGNTATVGSGAGNSSAANGGGIFTVVNLTLNNSQIVNNSAVGGNSISQGGGIFVQTPVVLSVNNSGISGNTASRGGGIFSDSSTTNLTGSTVSGNTATGNATSGGIHNNSGTLNVTNSTVSGNFTNGTAGLNGGGIISDSGTATLINATITNNTAAGANSASGVLKDNGTINVKNTVIAANVNNTTVPDVFIGTSATTGVFVSQGYNIIGSNGNAQTAFPDGNPNANNDIVGTTAAPVDPRLGLLADNGGTTTPHTLTHALLSDSPALDKGAAAANPVTGIAITTDQRGFNRPVENSTVANAAIGNGSDIGAFESQLSSTAATVSISGRVTTPAGSGIMNVRLTLTGSNGQVRTATTTASGDYRFEDVEVGETYILSAMGKRYSFSQPVQVLNINEETTEVNFIANTEKRRMIF